MASSCIVIRVMSSADNGIINPGVRVVRSSNPNIEGVVIHVDKPTAASRYVTSAFEDGVVWSTSSDMFEKGYSTECVSNDNEQENKCLESPKCEQKEEEEEECPICFEPYGGHRKAIECPSCVVKTCRLCVQKYIEDSGVHAQCHSCDTAFTRPFLIKNCGRTFVEQEYRELRKKLLLDGEIARLHEIMEILPLYKTRNSIKKKRDELKSQVSSNPWDEHAVQALIDMRLEYSRVNHEFQRRINNRPQKPSAHWYRYHRQCPSSQCNGLLNSKWYCASCEQWTCPQCLCIRGSDKDTPHKCDEETRATAAFILQETRNCPSCATPIYKINGCDQMWCTLCHTAFSWQTGRRVNGHIHNPHFFAWQRQLVTQQHPRTGAAAAAALVAANCNNNDLNELPNADIFEMSIQSAIYNSEQSIHPPPIITHPISWLDAHNHSNGVVREIRIIYEQVAHLLYHELPNIRDSLARYTTNENKDLRLRFAANELSREVLATTLLKRDNNHRSLQEQMQVLALVEILVCEAFRHLTLTAKNTIFGIYNTITRIRSILEFANKELLNISKCFNRRVVYTFVKDTNCVITPKLKKHRPK